MNADSKEPAFRQDTPPASKVHPVDYVPGKPIELLHCDAQIDLDGKTLNGDLTVFQNLSPPELYWECVVPDVTGIGEGRAEIRADFNAVGDVYRISSLKSAFGGGFFGEGIEFGGEHPLTQVVFYLPGMPQVVDVVLEADEWIVKLQPNRTYKSNEHDIPHAEVELSGIGVIRKKDGSKFKRSEAKHLLRVLKLFISIAFLKWTSPTLIYGASDNCKESWIWWADSEINLMKESYGWVDEWDDEDDQLKNAFSGFWSLCNKDEWIDHLELVATWMIQASCETINKSSAVVISQIPIELLSSVVIVTDNKILSAHDFEKLTTAGRFRILACFCEIPLQFPEELETIAKLAKHLECEAPEFLVKLRNSLIHPSSTIRDSCRKLEIDIEVVWHESSQLYCWFTNLILLRLFGHSGTFASRLYRYPSEFKTDKVPWESK